MKTEQKKRKKMARDMCRYYVCMSRFVETLENQNFEGFGFIKTLGEALDHPAFFDVFLFVRMALLYDIACWSKFGWWK